CTDTSAPEVGDGACQQLEAVRCPRRQLDEPKSGHDHVVFSVEVGFSANRTENTTSTENPTSRLYVLPQSSRQPQLISLDWRLSAKNSTAQPRQMPQTGQSVGSSPAAPAMDPATHRGNEGVA